MMFTVYPCLVVLDSFTPHDIPLSLYLNHIPLHSRTSERSHNFAPSNLNPARLRAFDTHAKALLTRL